MPKVTVDHSCRLPTQDAIEKIKTFFETDQDFRRLDPKMKCDFPSGSLNGKVKGSQFSADIKVKEDSSGSLISIVVDLPLILTPFKGKVQETIQKKLAKYLA